MVRKVGNMAHPHNQHHLPHHDHHDHNNDHRYHHDYNHHYHLEHDDDIIRLWSVWTRQLLLLCKQLKIHQFLYQWTFYDLNLVQKPAWNCHNVIVSINRVHLTKNIFQHFVLFHTFDITMKENAQPVQVVFELSPVFYHCNFTLNLVGLKIV